MMKSSSAILMMTVLGVFQHGTCSVPIKPCVPKSKCSCVNVDGLIDLHPLGNNDGTPRFRDIPDPDGKTFYSWNPCYGFDEAGCRDVAMCQINGATSQSLGSQSSLKSMASSAYGQMYQYTNWGGANLSGNVILTCDAGEEGVVTRRPDADFLNEFYLELKSKHACPQEINGSTSFQPTVSTTRRSTSFQPTVSTTRRQRPTTPAFIGTATTPSTPTTTTEPLFDLNSLGALMIVVLAVLILLVTVMLIMIFYIFFRFGNWTTTAPSPINDCWSNSSSKKGAILRGMNRASKIIFVYTLIGGLILNLLVVWDLKRHSKKRQQMKTTTDEDKASRRERQTTITIVTSSSVFLFLALPLATNCMIQTLIPDIYGPSTPTYYLFSLVITLSELLSGLSLSTDFVSYLCLTTSFRTTLFRILHIKQTESSSK